MMSYIGVSVICSVYNHEPYLSKCLDSMLEQETSFPYEILIHDDASTDGCQLIIKEYQEKYPHIIKAVLQNENQFSKGNVHVETILFPMVRGKYICYLEGDDYWCNKFKLQRQYDALENNDNCSIAVHKTQCVSFAGEKLNKIIGEGIFHPGIINGDDFLRIFLQGKKWPFQTSSFFARREVVTNRLDFWDKFYVGDLPFLLWGAACGNIYFCDEIMSCYRMYRAGSATLLNRNREYALNKAKTNAEGLLAFNKATSNKYWKYAKHLTYYYLYQYYAATGKGITKEQLKDIHKELSFIERVRLRLKFTSIGNVFRNCRENIIKKKLRKVE